MTLHSPSQWRCTSATTASPSTPTLTYYFDNIFPLKTGRLDFRSIFYNRAACNQEEYIRQRFLPSSFPLHYQIAKILPRVKEGGALVQLFSQAEGDSPTDSSSSVATISDESAVLATIRAHLAHSTGRSWFNLSRVRVFPVQATLFADDMVNWYPSNRLKVSFIGPDIPLEILYRRFRPFGRIFDITYHEPDTKGMPRYALVQFIRTRSATSARSCLYGKIMGDTRLQLTYQRVVRKQFIFNWISSHLRLLLPLLAAALIAVVYAVFDPVRIFMIESEIVQRFNPENYRWLRWVTRQTVHRLFPKASPDYTSHSVVWAERQLDHVKLDKWLHEAPETFILVHGPRESGKLALVSDVTRNWPNQIVIDGEALAACRNEHELLVTLAKQVGYRPVFSFMQNLTHFMDLAITATTGQKTALASGTDTQIAKILECVGVAIYQVRKTIHRKQQERQKGTGPTPWWKRFANYFQSDTQVDPSSGKTPTYYAQDVDKPLGDWLAQQTKLRPEDIPLVIITGFMERDVETHHKLLWDRLAQWATVLVENGAAHVVIESSNVTTSKVLSAKLPYKPLNSLLVSDATRESSLRVLREQFGLLQPPTEVHQRPAYDASVRALEKTVDCLGGRLSDLELFMQKVKGGQSVEEALEDIVQKTAAEVRKFALGDDQTDTLRTLGTASSANVTLKGGWTTYQFWYVLEALANSDQVNYYSLLTSPLFNGDANPLQALEYAELIHIEQEQGRPAYIRPARPVFHTVFQMIKDDKTYAAWMKQGINKQVIALQNSNITKYEEELQRLHVFADTSPDITGGQSGGWPRVLTLQWWCSWVWWPVGHQKVAFGARYPRPLGIRIDWLMGNLQKAQQVVQRLESENRVLQKYIDDA
ncbi:mitochondrial escape protein 2 [Dispira simplex]|nr:mitochondrial escape protein 2 [Dispira simplex]